MKRPALVENAFEEVGIALDSEEFRCSGSHRTYLQAQLSLIEENTIDGKGVREAFDDIITALKGYACGKHVRVFKLITQKKKELGL